MNDKEIAARHAVELVEDGMVVGLGTGSTANCFIEALAKRYQEEKLRVTTVASSVVSTIKAQQLGLPLAAMEHLARIDIYVDGADEVAPDLTLLKGRGYDLVKEKLLARASEQFLVLIDPSKQVSRIGEKFPIPVEVVPFAWQMVKCQLEKLGGQGNLRKTANQDGFVVTAHGSLVLDMSFPVELDNRTLNQALNETPGVVEHGIFHNLASAVIMGKDGKVEILRG